VVIERMCLPALEMGVRFMKVGQRAVVWKSFQVCATGLDHGNTKAATVMVYLPPESDVRYEVAVVRHIVGR
jgi:hypothetical protein